MGFLDKAKAAASDLTTQAKTTVDGAQTKKKANDLFHDLGVLTWAHQSGRATAESQSELERVNGELGALEAQGPLDTSIKTAPVAAPPPPGSVGDAAAAPPPPGGAPAAPPPPGEAAAAPPPPAAAPAPPPPPASVAPPPPPAGMGDGT